MTLIKELITIPEQTQKGDFVLQLAQGIKDPSRTIGDYVVTPQLAKCYDAALKLIKSSLHENKSRGTFLHGSFGSGKSHFMAILDLLLGHHLETRAKEGLAEVVAEHNSWLTPDKRFLLIPYHMIGARDMESAVFEGYVKKIQETHPTAPLPAIYQDGPILEDARQLRRAMGDERFFSLLNKDSDSGWGSLSGGWDGESFEAAVASPASDGERKRLVNDLLQNVLTSVKKQGDYIPMDDGLSELSKHAHSLGYTAVILFLDELILWLAGRGSDSKFMKVEIEKLVKLVDAGNANRPIPLISFIARQRDLRELVDKNFSKGDEVRSSSDALSHWEDRFDTIKLSDTNLYLIAEKRILKPKGPAERARIDEAFRQRFGSRQDVMDTLISTHKPEQFRQVYPFSPALIDVLVAVSSMLQRERTALKVLYELLVERRDSMKLGDLVPVGDLFDAVSEGNEAFDDRIRDRFETAKSLYLNQLLPVIEATNGMTLAEARSRPESDGKAQKLINDDRLVKTLILSALPTQGTPLQNLTASRLAALNFGTIKSPIAGREAVIVSNFFRQLAQEVGQVKVGEGTDPTIKLQVSGVDTDAIISDAMKTFDSAGARKAKIKEILLTEFGIPGSEGFHHLHKYSWRATERTTEILLSNVREQKSDLFLHRDNAWRVIIDYPFDDEGYGPKNDLETVLKIREDGGSAHTIVWLPRFFNQKTNSDFGKLVALDEIMKRADRFEQFVQHLGLAERSDAKSLLENRQRELHNKVRQALKVAYGLEDSVETLYIDANVRLEREEQFLTLRHGLPSLRAPAKSTLRDALEDLISQALAHQYPAHPEFEPDTPLRSSALDKAYELFTKSLETNNRIVLTDLSDRKLMRYLMPLKLGEMGENAFVPGTYWYTHFNKKIAERGASVPVTVGDLRGWLDEPRPMGLPREVANLVIRIYAAQASKGFFAGSAPMTGSSSKLMDEWELRDERLPTEEDWKEARHRASGMFGVSVGDLRNGRNVGLLADRIDQEVREHGERARLLVAKLGEVIQQVRSFGGDLSNDAPRLTSAQVGARLCERLLSASTVDKVTHLARIELEGKTPIAIGTSIKQSGAVCDALAGLKESFVKDAIELPQAGEAGQALLRRLVEAVATEEYVLKLSDALTRLKAEAKQIVLSAATQSLPLQPAPEPAKVVVSSPSVDPLPHVPTPSPPPLSPKGTRREVVVRKDAELDRTIEQLRELIKQGDVKITWEVL